MSNQHYTAVLADLRLRRSRLEAEILEIDALIQNLGRWGSSPAGPATSVPAPSAAMELAKKVPANQRYSNISVRWAVLWHLTEFVNGDQKTGEIASALLAGGYQSDKPRFGNLVSAVLSTMKAKNEVEIGSDGGYRVSEVGRRNWNHIRHGLKFQKAIDNALAVSPDQEPRAQTAPSRDSSIAEKARKSK